ncbi:helix-turn-helix domain-containing protein [Psychroflexus halocasei]|uniref:AraC-type DNA-binding protein n=1 Tax=Psychroflexus halocasei TaxID=908615 RepID=A0A1H4DQL3_9FLAO|nr:helix-turn-helix transcriptional regulator [Psychroflexus halocasei]SEA74799.1 AraC-type DNA-binding protein [Psychroflexus halocasei]
MKNNFNFFTEKDVNTSIDEENQFVLKPPFFLLIKKGHLIFEAHDTIKAEDSSITISAKREVVLIKEMSSDCELKLICYDRTYVRQMTFQLNLIQAFKFIYQNTKLSFALSPSDFKDLWSLITHIQSQLNNSSKNEDLKLHILRHLNYSFLYSTMDKLSQENDYQSQPSNQQEKLVLTFFKNLQEKRNFKLKVSDYAAMQNVTARYLSSTVKELTTMTAQEIIHRLLLSQAKKELSSNVHPISEVAYQLGFTDPYTFSHFFKRKSGISPTEYRKNYQD